MTSVTHEPLCRVDACPEPTNPDWHTCIVDGNPVIEHAHVLARSQRPDLKRSKTNIVALCHAHHQLQSDNKWAFHAALLPWKEGEAEIIHQWLTDERGNVMWRRDVGASTAEGEDAGVGRPARETSLSAAGASTEGASSSAGDTADPVSVVATTIEVEPSPTEPGASIQEDVEAPEPSTDASRKSRDGVRASSPATTPASVLPPECRLDEALEIAKQIGTAKNQNPWDAGDWVLETELRWPHEYAQGVEYLGYDKHSLLNVVRVARTFQNVQRDIASFTHYQTVLKVANNEGVETALHWLKRAVVAEWSVGEFRRQLYGVTPKTVRWTLEELTERAEEWTLAFDADRRSRLGEFLDWLAQ